MGWTAAELEEMRQADAEIDRSFHITEEDIRASQKLDQVAKQDVPMDNRIRQSRERKIQESRTYRKKYPDRIRASKKRNRERHPGDRHAYYLRKKERPYTDQAVIRLARQRAGLSQSQLAKLLHIGDSTLGNWERGLHAANWPLLYETLPELNHLYQEG